MRDRIGKLTLTARELKLAQIFEDRIQYFIVRQKEKGIYYCHNIGITHHQSTVQQDLEAIRINP